MVTSLDPREDIFKEWGDLLLKMNEGEEKIKNFLNKRNVLCEFFKFSESCHSVAQAADALNTNPNEIIKNICLIDEESNPIIAIVIGEDRVSTKRVAKALNIQRPKVADSSEIIKKTGFHCGATPSFGFNAKFLIDTNIIEKDFVYTSGGSQNSLLKISTEDLQKLSNGIVTRIRK